MRKGFTLIEILIATTIFVMMLIITMATFAWASSYNGKLTQLRLVSQNGREIAAKLSDDIRLANGSGEIRLRDESGVWKNILVGEITFLNCPNRGIINCKEVGLLSADPKQYLTAGSNSIFILQKDRNKAIFYSSFLTEVGGDNYRVYRMEKEYDPWSELIQIYGRTRFGVDMKSETDYWLSDKGVSAKIDFGGYGPVDTNQSQQPFAEFLMEVKTFDYSDTRPERRADFKLRTMVETRDYN